MTYLQPEFIQWLRQLCMRIVENAAGVGASTVNVATPDAIRKRALFEKQRMAYPIFMFD